MLTKKEIYKNAVSFAKVDKKKALEYYEQLFTLFKKEKKTIDGKYYKEIADLYKDLQMFSLASQHYTEYLKGIPKNTPDYGVTLNDIGVCLFNMGKFNEAIDYFNKIIAFAHIKDVYRNIANCYKHLCQYETCENVLLKAILLDPNDIHTHYDLSELYYLMKQYKKAIYYFIQSKTTDSKFIYNASFSYLAMKNFQLGYKLYEKRLDFNEICHQTKAKTRVDVNCLDYWDGKTLCNSILVLYEQGIGDNIQYFRFLIELVKKFETIRFTFITNKSIENIFDISDYTNLIIVSILSPPSLQFYNYKIYTMSIPFILGIKEILPNEINYIRIRNEKNEYWKDKFKNLTKYKVGIVYNGLLKSYLEKYIPLESFKVLCDLPVDIICIHRKSEIEKDVEDLSFKDRLNYYDIDIEEPFIDTIAILQNIDMLITIDTYIVHLAGVLGINTLLLLGNISEWRWGNESTTYWYKNVKILRSNETGKLEKVLPQVKDYINHAISK